MMTALSAPLNLSPLTLVAITIGAETGQSIKSLIDCVDDEVSELARAGVLKELQIPSGKVRSSNRVAPRPKPRHSVMPAQQAEFCFAD